MRSLGHFSSFGIACLSFSFLSLEVSFGSLRERERETVDNFPEITRNRKKKKKEVLDEFILDVKETEAASD